MSALPKDFLSHEVTGTAASPTARVSHRFVPDLRQWDEDELVTIIRSTQQPIIGWVRSLLAHPRTTVRRHPSWLAPEVTVPILDPHADISQPAPSREKDGVTDAISNDVTSSTTASKSEHMVASDYPVSPAERHKAGGKGLEDEELPQILAVSTSQQSHEVPGTTLKMTLQRIPLPKSPTPGGPSGRHATFAVVITFHDPNHYPIARTVTDAWARALAGDQPNTVHQLTWQTNPTYGWFIDFHGKPLPSDGEFFTRL